MVTGVDLPLVGDFSNVAAVLEEIAQRARFESAATGDPAILPYSPFGPYRLLVHFLGEKADGAQLQIGPEYPADRLGILRHDDELLTLVDVTQRNVAAHEKAFPIGCGHLVSDPFRDHLPLELGEGKKHIQGQSPHTVGGVESLGHGDKGDAVGVKQLHQFGEVGQRPGQPIDFVDDHIINFSGPDIGQKSLQVWTLQRAP
jgi:hypothetical protein